MRTAFALLGGAVIGAGAALLFAPQTGRATRAKLRNRSSKYAHEVTDFVEKKTKHLRNKMQGYRHKAEKMLEHGQEMMTEGMAKVREKGHEMGMEGEAKPSAEAGAG